MRLCVGDSVITKEIASPAIVIGKKGNLVHVKFPDGSRNQLSRSSVRPVAELMAEARKKGTKYSNNLSLTNFGSTLAQLVSAFGWSSISRLRSETLAKVINQLRRAGLEIETDGEIWTGQVKFSLYTAAQKTETPTQPVEVEEPDQEEPSALEIKVSLPEPFWPNAFGLNHNLEIPFLRSLTESSPILCVLYLPENHGLLTGLAPVWEGLVTWAYLEAQRFIFAEGSDSSSVFHLSSGALNEYLKPSLVESRGSSISDKNNSLNLVVLKNSKDISYDSEHLKAIWPGYYFEFRPEWGLSSSSSLVYFSNKEIQALAKTLCLIGGRPVPENQEVKKCSLLSLFLWAKEASDLIISLGAGGYAEAFSNSESPQFKGSNETAIALALKTFIADWAKQNGSKFNFEKTTGNRRVDVFIEGFGNFEVETMRGSGPIEVFYHDKVWSRANKANIPLNVMVPTDAILWAGPYLADIAYHLSNNIGKGKKLGKICFPSARKSLVTLESKQSYFENLDDIPQPPLDEVIVDQTPSEDQNKRVSLDEIRGYEGIKTIIHEEVIWVEKNRSLLRGISRASGILLFGPPGCGKSRFAQAIAGELGQESRLLGPSDLKGYYLGEGQLLVRQQFDWLLENEKRLLIIDEIDAIAHSRRTPHGSMHTYGAQKKQYAFALIS